MSVKAYKILINHTTILDNVIKIEKTIEKTPTFNITHHENIFKIFQEYGVDCTNEDCIGQIEIDNLDFENYMDEFDFTDEERNILKKIKKDLIIDNYLSFECM